MKTGKKRGRPVQPVPKDKADSVIEWVGNGGTLLEWARQPGNPTAWTVYYWRDKDPEFAQRLARARDIGEEIIAQECLRIADTPLEGQEIEETANGKIKSIRRGDMLGHRKLQIETRLKLLACWNPGKYAERRKLEHSGRIGLEELVAGDE